MVESLFQVSAMAVLGFINIKLALFRDETNTRDYLDFGNTRRKEYATALEYICALLVMDPGDKVQFVMPGFLPCW